MIEGQQQCAHSPCQTQSQLRHHGCCSLLPLIIRLQCAHVSLLFSGYQIFVRWEILRGKAWHCCNTSSVILSLRTCKRFRPLVRSNSEDRSLQNSTCITIAVIVCVYMRRLETDAKPGPQFCSRESCQV